MDPAEFMKQKGIMGNQNVIEKIVHVEDKEKMREFEERLQREKEEIRAKSQKEKDDIEN